MRQVKLIPRAHCHAIREWGDCASSSRPFGLEDCMQGMYPARRLDRARMPFCRCCGYQIDRGARAFKVLYWFHRDDTAAQAIYLHESPCRWGDAHDREPEMGSPARMANREKFMRERQIEQIIRRARDPREGNPPVEKCGPVITRRMDPAERR